MRAPARSTARSGTEVPWFDQRRRYYERRPWAEEFTGNARTGSGSLALLQSENARPVLLGELEDPAAAARHAGERVIRDHHRQSGFFHQQLIDVSQQRAAAREHDAALGDI